MPNYGSKPPIFPARVFSASCGPCSSGRHPRCNVSVSSGICQCACRDGGKAWSLLTTPIVSGSGTVVGMVTADGRKFAFGPGRLPETVRS